MDLSRFWELIETSRAHLPADPDEALDYQARVLEETLVGLTPEEIVAFDACFNHCFWQAYRWELWGAAYIINGGCSDDGFIDFRSWLIAQGKRAYEAALTDPQSLIRVASTEQDASFEEFASVAAKAYERRTGDELPESDFEPPEEPAGEPWSEDSDELASRFPKLWKKFGKASA